jgi:hypothetical protein
MSYSFHILCTEKSLHRVQYLFIPFLCCTVCQGYLGLHAQLRGMDRPVAWYGSGCFFYIFVSVFGKKVAVSFKKHRIVLMCVDYSVTHQTINLPWFRALTFPEL